MTQEHLDDLEPESDPDVKALRLEVEELKQEEDMIRFLRQEKEDQLRTIIFRHKKKQ